jgi:hypothetical protein
VNRQQQITGARRYVEKEISALLAHGSEAHKGRDNEDIRDPTMGPKTRAEYWIVLRRSSDLGWEVRGDRHDHRCSLDPMRPVLTKE